MPRGGRQRHREGLDACCLGVPLMMLGHCSEVIMSNFLRLVQEGEEAEFSAPPGAIREAFQEVVPCKLTLTDE